MNNVVSNKRRVPIGTVHNGYKKVAEGKWVKESKGGSKKVKDDQKLGRRKKVESQAKNKLKIDNNSKSSNNMSDEEKDYFVSNKKEIMNHLKSNKNDHTRNSVKEAIRQHKESNGISDKKKYKSSSERITQAEKTFKKEVSRWVNTQRDFYKHEKAQEPNSPQRKRLATLIRKKGVGTVEKIKSEGKDVKKLGDLVGKVLTGRVESITSEEKSSLKNTALHVGLVLASMIVGGEVGGQASSGMADMLGGFATHWLEHVVTLSSDHALIFDKGMDHYLEYRKLGGESALNYFIDGLSDHIENGDIPSEVFNKYSNV